jgi:hypothetical protein
MILQMSQKVEKGCSTPTFLLGLVMLKRGTMMLITVLGGDQLRAEFDRSLGSSGKHRVGVRVNSKTYRMV